MRSLLMIMLVLLPGLAQKISAQGDLLVSPVRVVFEGNNQKEEISLVNTGNDSAIYSVSLLHYNMTEDGNFEMVEKPDEGQMFADSYLRIFPRRVSLAPRESQVVRVQFRRRSDMMSGEYRSHLYFRAEKDNKPLGQNLTPKDPQLMSVQITPVFGISIPVIIRTGDVHVVSSLSSMKIEVQQDTIVNLKLTINRTGNISVYGDILAEYVPSSGKPVEIGDVRGVAVYTSTNKRNFSIRLKNLKGVNLTTGKLRVTYTSPRDTPYVLYAEKELVLK
jgi:hypothetical protein